jgi:hypothetical protein
VDLEIRPWTVSSSQLSLNPVYLPIFNYLLIIAGVFLQHSHSLPGGGREEARRWQAWPKTCLNGPSWLWRSRRRTARVGRRSSITSPMLKALCTKLIEQPYLYRFEMSDFLYDTFGKSISERSIARTLRSIGWTRKVIRRIAQQRNADLRDYYLYRMSKYRPDQLIFVDESGLDGRAGHRRWGWSPKRVLTGPCHEVQSRKAMAYSSSMRPRWNHFKASISRIYG